MNPGVVDRIRRRCHVRARDGALAILLAALRIMESRASISKTRVLLGGPARAGTRS